VILLQLPHLFQMRTVRIGRKLTVNCNKKLPSLPLTTLKGRE
jgi:hypothetical protein